MFQHEFHHPILEFVHQQHGRADAADALMSHADGARAAIRVVAAGRAFREYNWLADSVGYNSVGDLRGMVVSAKWRVVFAHVGDVGEYMENIGFLASLAAGLAESAPEIERIVDSSESSAVKSMRMLTIAGTISERTLLGVVPAGVHLIYEALEGWCMLAGLADGKVGAASSVGLETLKSADTLVQTTFKTLTDANNQSKALWTVITVMTSDTAP